MRKYEEVRIGRNHAYTYNVYTIGEVAAMERLYATGNTNQFIKKWVPKSQVDVMRKIIEELIEDDDYDEEEGDFMLGDSHIDGQIEETEEGEGGEELLIPPMQNKAFIVSKDTVQIVGYEVEEIKALSATARELVHVLEHTPQSKMGFQ